MERVGGRRLRKLGGHLLAPPRPLRAPPLLLAPRPLAVSSFSLEPVTPGFGAEVFGFDFERLARGDEELLREIDAAFLKYKVLMFRGAGLDAEGQIRFLSTLARFWGIAEPKSEQQRQSVGPNGLFVNPNLAQIKGQPEVWPVDVNQEYGWGRVDQGVIEVENVRSRAVIRSRAPGNVKGGTNLWHSDQMNFEEPSSVTTLRAVRLPAVGGDTLFANMEQAYEDLDDAIKARLEGLSTENWTANAKTFEEDARRTGDSSYLEWFKKHFARRPRFPVVRTHPVTGRRAIYVNRSYTVQILDGPDGKKVEDSAELSRKLSELANVPEYQCRMRWHKPGDVVMWDNRSVQHYAIADYGDPENGGGPRWMDHVATLGTKPI